MVQTGNEKSVPLMLPAISIVLRRSGAHQASALKQNQTSAIERATKRSLSHPTQVFCSICIRQIALLVNAIKDLRT
jgi:hypothetical protein